MNQALWNDGDQLRLRYEMECIDVVWNGYGDETRASQFLKPCIDGICRKLADEEIRRAIPAA